MRDAKPQRLIKALRDEGFTETSGGKHVKMVKIVNDRPISIPIPIHGIIKRNVVDNIRKMAGLSREKFYSYKF